jgi:flagellar FliJ protein
MKKFSFTMQSLLNVKIALEKQIKSELAESQQRLLLFQKALRAKEEEIERLRTEARARVESGTNVSELRQQSAGFAALFDNLQQQKHKVEVAEEEMRRVQMRMVDTMGERKMLEKLKEKQLLAYGEEVRRSEAVMIDDFLANKLNP